MRLDEIKAAILAEIARVKNPYGGDITTQRDRDTAAQYAKSERKINRDSGDYKPGSTNRLGAKSGTDTTSTGPRAVTTKSYNNPITKTMARPASQGKNVNEVSNDLLGKYKSVASKDASAADKSGDTKKADKRFSGIVKATKKQFDNDKKPK